MTASIDFILGRAGSGKTYTCYEEISRIVKAEPLGRPLILLVPEHCTYAAERELLEHLPSKSDMRTIVTGFRRLAWRVLRDSRSASLPGISKLGKRLLLKKILLRREKELEVLKRAAGQRRFTEPLETLIEEFKNHGVEPEVLLDVSEELSRDKLFSKKLGELALLYMDYRKETEGKYQDSDDRMLELAKAVPSSALFDGAEVWIDGFLFFNPHELSVLDAIFRTAEAVHITLPMDRDIPFRTEMPPSYLFFKASQTMQSIKEIAANLKSPVKVRILGDSHRFETEGLKIVEQRLFDYGEYAAEDGAGVKLTEAATRRLEAEAAAADIVRVCRERGWRWNDFGILLRDEENYRDIVEEMLSDYHVPFYTDWKRAAVHHPLAELIRSALESVTQGWRYESVFRCVKTGMMKLSEEEADELENYVLASGVRGEKAWGNTWAYRQMKPGETEEQKGEILERLNRERETVYNTLHEFSENLAAAENVKGLVTAVYTLLEGLEAGKLLADMAAEAERAGELDEAAEHRRIWSSVMELFDELVNITGEESMKTEDFSDLLCDGLDTLEIALVPPGNDAVTVASFDQNSLDNIKAIYILGANDGVMPKRSAEKGLLTESDRLRIQEAAKGKIELAPGRIQESANENYLMYQGFSEASTYLWVSWALSDSEGDGLTRSAVVRRLHSILNNPIDMIPLEGAAQREEFQFTQPKRAVGQLASALRSCISGDNEQQDWTSVYNWALEHEPERLSMLCKGALSRAKDESIPPTLASRLYTSKKRMEGSVSQFETFAQCPFRYFAQYGLHLEERSEFTFRALDYGNLLHKIMYRFAEIMRRDKRDWSSVTPEEQQKICHKLIEEEAPKVQNEILYSTEQYKNLMTRIEDTVQESISRAVGFSAASKFKPVMFEKAFGKNSQEGAVMSYKLSNGAELDLTGKIDRIDVGEMQNSDTGEVIPYFLVIDYKTGSPELSMMDVYEGLNLQLLTYVVAAERILAAHDEKRMPAGIFYCYLANPTVPLGERADVNEALKKVADELRFKGWFIESSQLIQTIDSTNTYLCVKLKKGNELPATKNTKTQEQLKTILDYTEAHLTETAENILQGDIRVRPFKNKKRNACKYCQYRSVCGFDVKIGSMEYVPDNMDDGEILSAMKKKIEKGGSGK